MSDVNSAPKLSKKRKLGKNKKKSWRVSKIEEVEDFLDDERRQILTGGLVTEKTDETLFVIDKKAKEDTPSSETKSRKSFRNRPLNCVALLQPDPHSKVVRKPDDVTFQKGKKRTQRLIERTKALTQARLLKKQKRPVTEKLAPTGNEDLWSDDANDSSQPKAKRPKTASKKPSALSATPFPHPGTSINPAFEDHQALLSLAHQKEVQKVKKEKKLYNSLDAKFPSSVDESTYLVEMSAGLIDDFDNESEDENDTGFISANPPVRREDRKTRKQKRMKKDLEIQAKEKLKEEVIKKRENMVLRLPSIKSEINKQERLRKEREALKLKQQEEEKFKTRRLGSIKFEEPDLDLKLSTELTASYRELKPEGQPIVDIFKSIQRRNIVEPRVKQRMKRKYKPKVFIKKSHKAVKL
ncbi:ribosome biogenesis protein NOP53-like [Biomphalaria glabrata]|uniref:Ribosome biogenesis protein NOP53 n=1 Tax=Biomphalaria glabrata TaxID=6526 RepID=A0A2C9LSY0_BIOGL|nr:ribosome biogenesis protein NOP53-like [Biomphalaria glabrata]